MLKNVGRLIFSPRSTFRQIQLKSSNLELAFLLLEIAIVSGSIMMIVFRNNAPSFEGEFGMSSGWSPPLIQFAGWLNFIVAPISVLVGTFFIWIAGRLLRGRGSFADVLRSVVWSLASCCFVFFVAILLQYLCIYWFPSEATGTLVPFSAVIVLLGTGWMFCVFTIVVAEAHQFGIMRSVVAMFVSYFLFALAALGVARIFA